MKRSRLNIVGHSDTATKRQEIQNLVRLIVTYRDGGCILRNLRYCGAEAYVSKEFQIVICDVPNVVIQADHLITRANSATFADTRLIVCLCKNCHGWKHYHEKEYEKLVKSILSPYTVELWDKCEADRQAHKTYKLDLSMAIVALKQELKTYEDN